MIFNEYINSTQKLNRYQLLRKQKDFESKIINVTKHFKNAT